MQREFQVTRNLMGYDITASVKKLDFGLDVTILGGQLSHIGAVTIVDEIGELHTITLPEHKETRVCEALAAAIYFMLKEPVSVLAGVHYDNLEKTQLTQVISELEKLQEDVMKQIKQRYTL